MWFPNSSSKFWCASKRANQDWWILVPWSSLHKSGCSIKVPEPRNKVSFIIDSTTTTRQSLKPIFWLVSVAQTDWIFPISLPSSDWKSLAFPTKFSKIHPQDNFDDQNPSSRHPYLAYPTLLNVKNITFNLEKFSRFERNTHCHCSIDRLVFREMQNLHRRSELKAR